METLYKAYNFMINYDLLQLFKAPELTEQEKNIIQAVKGGKPVPENTPFVQEFKERFTKKD